MIVVGPTNRRPWTVWTALRDGTIITLGAPLIVYVAYAALPDFVFLHVLFPGLLPDELEWARYVFVWSVSPILSMTMLATWSMERGVLDEITRFAMPAMSLSRSVAFALVGTMAIVGTGYASGIFWPEQNAADTETYLYLLNSPMSWFTAFLIVAIAPVSEELIWRGFMFSVFAQSKMGTKVAALTTSAAWALLHSYSIPGTVTVFLTGLVLCALFYKSKSIWPSVAVHCATNIISVVSILFFADSIF